jgi:hypothetical protein
VEPEDVVDVLGRMVDAVRLNGVVLDLQVIRPNPQIEVGSRVVGEIDGEPLFLWADAAVAAVDARVSRGDLVEEAVDDHDVLKHYSDGAELVDGVETSVRCLHEPTISTLLTLDRPLVVRERCRLRRLRVS